MRYILIIGLAAMLSGCNASSVSVEDKAEGRFTARGNYTIFKDNETGCKYFIKDSGYAQVLSPLYDKEGKVEGCGK